MTADAGHLATLLEAAAHFGWGRHHQRPARTVNGYRTAITGDTGYPDLVLARRGQVLHFEIKGQNGYPTKNAKTGRYPQLDWLANLPNAWLVRPDALDEALALITGKAQPHQVTCTLAMRPDQWRLDGTHVPAHWAGPLAAWATKRYPPTNGQVAGEAR